MMTADAVARAIVAACKETGENPIEVATPKLGSAFRARHYAMWALIHVFNAKPKIAATVVGSQGVSFFNASRQNMLGDRRPGGGSWWDEAAYGRVITAAQNLRVVPPYKDGPLPPVTAPNAPRGESIRRANHATLDRASGYRPAPGTIEQVLRDDAEDDEPVFDHGRIAPEIGRRRPMVARTKREMEEDLRRAVENTAKMTPKD